MQRLRQQHLWLCRAVCFPSGTLARATAVCFGISRGNIENMKALAAAHKGRAYNVLRVSFQENICPFKTFFFMFPLLLTVPGITPRNSVGALLASEFRRSKEGAARQTRRNAPLSNIGNFINSMFPSA